MKDQGIFITKYGKASESFELRDIELNNVNDGEVLISVESFGLNYADVMARTGLYNDAPPLPFVPGYEVVGRVRSTGKNVNSVQVGDRVVAFTRFGAYATVAIADERAVVPLPDSISNEVATALATQYCTAYYCGILSANMQEGETVLVHAAAGGVGTALVQLAKWKKCKVFGTASRKEKLDYLDSLGCDYPINYQQESYADVITNTLNKEQVDVIFNPIGGKTFKTDRTILASGGRHILYGVSTWSGKKGNLLDKIKLALDFGFMHPLGLLMKSQGATGVNMLRIADNKPHIIGKCLNACIELYNQKLINPQIGGVFNSSEIAAAHDLLEGRASMGKIAVNW